MTIGFPQCLFSWPLPSQVAKETLPWKMGQDAQKSHDHQRCLLSFEIFLSSRQGPGTIGSPGLMLYFVTFLYREKEFSISQARDAGDRPLSTRFFVFTGHNKNHACWLPQQRERSYVLAEVFVRFWGGHVFAITTGNAKRWKRNEEKTKRERNRTRWRAKKRARDTWPERTLNWPSRKKMQHALHDRLRTSQLIQSEVNGFLGEL